MFASFRVVALLVGLAVGFAAIGSPERTAQAARPTAPRLLPRTTAALVWAPSVPDWNRRFLKTAPGQMGMDPSVQPIVMHLFGSLVDAAKGLQDRTSLTLPEILSIPEGELALAVVATDGEGPAGLLVCDAGKQLVKARQVLERTAEALEVSGAQRSEETIAGTKLISFETQGRRQGRVAYFEKDTTVVLGTNREAVRQVLNVWGGKPGATLADNERFAAVLRHSREGQENPPLVFFADPIALVRSAGDLNPGMQVGLAMLPVLGLDGLLGLGGSYVPDAGQFDSVLHASILTNTPRSGVLEVVALDSGDTTPEPWMPADVASYTTFSWKFGPSYRKLATLYDGIRGDDAWSKLIKARVGEPLGLDVEKDVLPLLAGRVSWAVWVERPVTPQSRRSLIALRLKDGAAATKLLDKLAEKYREKMSRHAPPGRTYFEVPLPRPPAPPPGTPGAPPATAEPPALCIGVLEDYLVFSDRNFYRKVLTGVADSARSLADELDYKLVASRANRLSAGARPAMVGFGRPEENLRFLYDLAQSETTRKNLKDAGKNNWLARTLYAALEANRLPPFETIARYFAPSGAVLVDDASGLHYTSFSLRRAGR